MKPTSPQRIPVIDSHTGGEPTRVIVGGVAEPAGDTMTEKRAAFAGELDWLRSATVCEPRGHEALVGALLCEPCEADCVTGIIFFNNVGVLNGCLHGTMGVAVTLLHQGKIGAGIHRFDTPTGVVSVDISSTGTVAVENIRCFRIHQNIELDVPEFGRVTGDIAWGGNWFFLTDAPRNLAVIPENVEALTRFSWTIRQLLNSSGHTEVDHIEVFGPPADSGTADSRNFVLCPGKVYDRSPCGTGTSAKLACLFDDGILSEGQIWRQAGILNSIFEGTFSAAPDGGVLPTVTGTAIITAEAELLIDPSEPFAFGIPCRLS